METNQFDQVSPEDEELQNAPSEESQSDDPGDGEQKRRDSASRTASRQTNQDTDAFDPDQGLGAIKNPG